MDPLVEGEGAGTVGQDSEEQLERHVARAGTQGQRAGRETGARRIARNGAARHCEAQALRGDRGLAAPVADGQYRLGTAAEIQADDLDLDRRVVVARHRKRRHVTRHGRRRRAGGTVAAGVEAKRAVGCQRRRRAGREIELGRPEARRHVARRVGQHDRTVPRRGEAIEFRRRLAGRLLGRQTRALARPFQGVAQGRVQRLELGERLAPSLRQATEGAVTQRLVTGDQGIAQQPRDAQRFEQLEARHAIGARLQRRPIRAYGDQPVADRRLAGDPVFGQHDEQPDNRCHDDRDRGPQTLRLDRQKSCRHATVSSTAAGPVTGGGLSARSVREQHRQR